MYTPKSILARLRGHSAARGRECTLTADQVAGLLAPMRCAVTGAALHWPAGGPTYDLLAPSLDRIDNREGYVPGNVHCVALWVNLARNGAALEDFLAVLQTFKDS